MFGHGLATLFLASVYGDEEDTDRREHLRRILTRAVTFIGEAQSTQGGWSYTSAKDSNDQDEGSVTVTQLQALRACRNAGIHVPRSIIDKARKYLERATTANGGGVYQLGRGGTPALAGQERPALTAAAISCGFSAGEYHSPLVKKWFAFCARTIPLGGSGRFAHFEYTHYYYAQAMYILGDDGYHKLFPRAPQSEWLTWSRYRKLTFARLKSTQKRDGSWSDGDGIGPVYATALYLTLLQLDRGTVPIYQR